jgi:hypothetical protein
MSVDYGKQFGQIFWQRVCQRYRDLIIDTTATEFVFDFTDVRRPFEEGGIEDRRI